MIVIVLNVIMGMIVMKNGENGDDGDDSDDVDDKVVWGDDC